MLSAQGNRQTIAESFPTQWYDSDIRPIVAADDGKLVVGRTGSQWFVGRIEEDGSLIERLSVDGTGTEPIPVWSVVAYALLDPPVESGS